MASAYHLRDVGVCTASGGAGTAPAGLPPAQKNAVAVDAQLSGSLQSGPELWVPLSVPEIRRLLWRLVLATKQTIGQILDWSAWRRWHQGMAQFYHYKQRVGPEVQL